MNVQVSISGRKHQNSSWFVGFSLFMNESCSMFDFKLSFSSITHGSFQSANIQPFVQQYFNSVRCYSFDSYAHNVVYAHITVHCQYNIILHQARVNFDVQRHICLYVCHCLIHERKHNVSPFIAKSYGIKIIFVRLNGNATQFCSSCNLSNTTVVCQISVI